LSLIQPAERCAITFDLSQTFEVFALRIGAIARKPACVTPNFLRGALGKALHDPDPEAYRRWFAPRSDEGPSGLRDAPRAFVIRAADQSVGAGARFEFDFHLFDIRDGAVERAVRAIARFADIESVEGTDLLRLSIDSSSSASRVRVCFVTPTELKGAEQPEFSILFARLRDRISTLRELYQDGPLEIDFKAMAERAAKIRMTRCDIEHAHAERTSRSTGCTHSLGGFIGVAEYEGELGEFLPYLEIGRYTGVGRQTVWGKGAIHAVVA
jgi:hypothetical protein